MLEKSFAENLRTARFWKTLRFRLAAWNAVVVIITALVMLVVLRQGVRWALVHELDQVLIDDAREVALDLDKLKAADLPRLHAELALKASGHEQRGWYVKLLDDRENVLWFTPEARPSNPRPEIQGDLAPVSFAGYRIVQYDLPTTVAGVSRVRVGAKLDFIERDMARIDRGVLLAAGAVLVAAPLAGYWLAARAAKTVGDIISTAARLRPSELNERLAIRGAGDELDQLAHTINSLLDRIAEYLKIKRDFLANAAHELRTPLAAIRSTIEVALNSNRSPQEYEDLMVDVIDECSLLETLVNQLLLLSETEAELPAARFEPVSLDELTRKSIEMFTGVAEGRGVRLQSGRLARARVLGNPQHLRQMLNNLIDNAVKYTAAGGDVVVELEVNDDRQLVELSVRDTGPGIAQEEQRLIFDRFYRAEAARTRMGGSKGAGLGLSICQSVVHNHGGTIECVSQPDRGATFTVALPLHRA